MHVQCIVLGYVRWGQGRSLSLWLVSYSWVSIKVPLTSLPHTLSLGGGAMFPCNLQPWSSALKYPPPHQLRCHWTTETPSHSWLKLLYSCHSSSFVWGTGGSLKRKNERRACDLDVNDWFIHFRHAASHNNWDDNLCVSSIVFYLMGVALRWYQKSESAFTTWT